MDKDDYGLSDIHKLFCEYYLQNNNAGLSYRRAFDPLDEKGLKDSSCYTSGSRLLKKENIQKYLNKLRKEIRTENLMSASEILSEINALAVNPNIKPSERLKALELLGKNQMLFSEKIVTDSQVEINLIGIDEERKVIEHIENELLEHHEEE